MRFVRYWLLVYAIVALVIAASLLGGLFTGAWAGEGKNVSRWFAVVTSASLAGLTLWARALMMRKIRSGEYPPQGRR